MHPYIYSSIPRNHLAGIEELTVSDGNRYIELR